MIHINLAHSENENGERLFSIEKYHEALPLLLKDAEDGRARSFGMLARMYGNGWGVEKDLEKSYFWALKGVKKNDPESLYVMGYMYENGIYLKRNIDEAEFFYLKAADQLYERAIQKLGYFYAGTYVEKKDYEKAEKWIRKSAELGMPYEQYRLGYFYCCALDDKKKNFSESEKWLKKADANGEKNSAGLLGKMYAYGFVNSKPDYVKAAPYVEKAYEGNKDEYIKVMDRVYSQVLYDSVDTYSEELKIKARRFYDDLRADENFYWFKHQAKMYNFGRDRPTNLQKSFEYDLLALEKLINTKMDKSTYEYEFSSTVSSISFTFRRLQKREGVGGELEYAWLNKNLFNALEKLNSDNEIYPGASQALVNSYNQRLDEIIGEVPRFDLDFYRNISIPQLVKLSRKFLNDRRAKYGYVEVDDIVAEGWKYYIGDGREINEPLAYNMMEEALRLAILKSDKRGLATARNNLGAIASGSINKYVKNERMALIHLKDGYDSDYGPSNLLWKDFTKKISLTDDERTILRERFKRSKFADHPSVYLESSQIKDHSDIRSIVNYLKRFSIENTKDVYVRNGLCHLILENIEILGMDQARACFRDAVEQISEAEGVWLGAKKYDLIQLINLREESLKYVAKLNKAVQGNFVSSMPDVKELMKKVFPDVTRGMGGDAFIDASTKNLNKSKSNQSGLYALVIGNGDYLTKNLRNPTNDAESISRKLKSFGFNVKKLVNLDSKKLKKAIYDFQNDAKDAEVVVVFYAGHGVQLGGVNYLLPINVDLEKGPEQVIANGYSVNDLKNNLPGRTKLIFLDACRNNPFKYGAQRSLQSEGLAPINNIPSGVLISFSTKDGGVALDAPTNSIGSSNSPYTAALVNNLSKEQDIVFVLRQVRSDVMSATNNKQEPWEYSNLNSGQLVISKLK